METDQKKSAVKVDGAGDLEKLVKDLKKYFNYNIP